MKDLKNVTLGKVYIDSVTKFKGICTCKCEYLKDTGSILLEKGIDTKWVTITRAMEVQDNG